MRSNGSIAGSALTFKRADAERAHVVLWQRFSRDPRWANALAKAWRQLQRADWQWNGDELIARSEHTAEQRYFATIANGCDCGAGARGWVCWHAAGCHILTTAAHLAQAKNN